MASSGNFATMNPLHKTSNSVVYSQGNLKTSPSSNWSSTTWCFSNIVIPKDKKIYVEARLSAGAGVYASLAAATNLSTPGTSEVGSDGSVSLYNESKYVNGTRSASWITAASAGDILQLAIDGSNNKVWLGYNNTWGGSGNPSAGSNEAGTINTSTALGYDIFIACTQNSVSTMTFNFGQDSTFGGEVSAGGNADANGFGDFKYSPPTGFLALCTGNLSVSADIDPAQTDTNISEKQCGAVLYTGNGGSNAITGLGFQPDLVWMKQRSSGSTFSNGVVDSSRGASLGTYFNRTNADTDFSSDFSSFDNDGFTLASGSAANINNSGVTFIGWGWKANGGTTSSNGNGSITSSVQANTKAGFSIVTYTGGGSSGTVGHGLNKAPEFVISKKRSGTQSWYALATPFGQGYFNVSGNGSYSSGNDPFNSSAPTTTVVGASGDNVTNSATYIYYCWHSVEGFSKFSKFEGNGNADGAFVYTGFRPKMLVIKDGDNSERAWVVYDDKRNTFNPVKNTVGWNLNGSEDTSSYPVDFLSNGFKLRTTNNLVNASSTYFYACWGSVPFRYNNTF